MNQNLGKIATFSFFKKLNVPKIYFEYAQYRPFILADDINLDTNLKLGFLKKKIEYK
ncbi:MAG: hypothetical protein CM15mP4_3320 [Candidatus Neomarinimicrobiota bacterium]|nr:MAG: hypothetical protein CM15mP4_3320 [Candidatus Neomarinimicrobiota bacterium]